MFKYLKAKVTPFGGLYIIHKQLLSNKFAQFIDGELDHRVKTTGCNYFDTILTRFYTAFCGGTATEDMNYLRDHTLNTLKRFTPPLADTILRAEKELATPCQNI